MQHGVLLEEDDTAAAADDFPFDADADDGFLIKIEIDRIQLGFFWLFEKDEIR